MADSLAANVVAILLGGSSRESRPNLVAALRQFEDEPMTRESTSACEQDLHTSTVHALARCQLGSKSRCPLSFSEITRGSIGQRIANFGSFQRIPRSLAGS